MALVASVLAIGSAAPAGATPFTLLNPIVIDGTEIGNSGVVGELRPVRDGFGEIDVSGIILAVPQQDGTINAGFVGQDIFVVDLVVTAGSVDELGMTVGIGFPAFLTNPVGAGAFDDSTIPLPLVEPGIVTADPSNQRGLFDFSASPVGAGQTTVRLFIVTSPEFQMRNDQTVSFMVSSPGNFTVQGTIIPEPTTALLVVLGLAGLGFASRRRTRR